MDVASSFRWKSASPLTERSQVRIPSLPLTIAIILQSPHRRTAYAWRWVFSDAVPSFFGPKRQFTLMFASEFHYCMVLTVAWKKNINEQKWVFTRVDRLFQARVTFRFVSRFSGFRTSPSTPKVSVSFDPGKRTFRAPPSNSQTVSPELVSWITASRY